MSITERLVLAIDDEPQIRRAIQAILKNRGFRVAEAATGAESLDAILQRTPDLIVLDLSLPDVDGIELCSRLRSWLNTPIIVLSVRSDESDKIAALEAGADDYVTKPFSAGELVARIHALLRRAGHEQQTPPAIDLDDLHVDFARHEVRRGDERVQLTPIEFSILSVLASHADRMVTWRQVAIAVWGEHNMVDTRTIRVHVSNLRRKLEAHPSVPQYIITEPGIGLRFCTH